MSEDETRNMHHDIEAIQNKIQGESAFVKRLVDAVGRVIVGQRYMVERLLIGLLADGHVLMEGVPGLAKTMTVRTLAGAIQTSFHRIQFTPDIRSMCRSSFWLRRILSCKKARIRCPRRRSTGSC